MCYNIHPMKMRGIRNIIIYSLAVLLVSVSCVNPVFALTTDELNAQKRQLEESIRNNQSAASNKASEAQSLSRQISNIEGDIKNAETKIESTGQSLNQTQAEIDALSGKIDTRKKELELLKKKLNASLVEIYRSSMKSEYELILGATSLSQSSNEKNYLQAVEGQVKILHTKVTEAKTALETQKSDQEKKKAELDNLKKQQEAYKSNIEYQRTAKDKLLNMTVAQKAEYEAKVASLQAQRAKVQAQIDALTTTRAWGTQITSSNESSWYYSQTGNNTRLGNSIFTVADYGCLITSIAMISTYYGGGVSPTDIAHIASNFNSEGYLLNSTPPPVYNISVSSSRSVNWSTVNSELDNGRPVIVSIYLPSVGAVNSDKSSHFIVIKGHSGDRYYMHDPIAGQRGYDINQVRSMKLVSPR